MTREPIYAALFAKANALNGSPFVTVSRKLKHWNDVDIEQMPYVAQVQVSEEPRTTKGMPPVWTFRAQWYVYVGTNADQDDSVTPSILLNPCLDALTNAIAPPPGLIGTQTLGGLVSHCWIAGAIETFEGLLGSKEVAIISIEMLVPFS